MNVKHKIIRWGEFSVEEILPKIGTMKPVYLMGHKLWLDNNRYKNFKQNGVKCISCGLEGKTFVLESSPGHSPYINLYSTFAGVETLMTRDHIIPQARGGDSSIGNLQTMCAPCNNKKGCLTNEEFTKCIPPREIINAKTVWGQFVKTKQSEGLYVHTFKVKQRFLGVGFPLMMLFHDKAYFATQRSANEATQSHTHMTHNLSEVELSTTNGFPVWLPSIEFWRERGWDPIQDYPIDNSNTIVSSEISSTTKV